MSVAATNDAELVNESLSGNRDAFGQIVSRYQSLICSLAFSATGSLSQSEDLAQETFVTAWKQLSDLREREKLRAWLCGIARNLINNSLRKQGREPSHRAGSLEEISEAPSPEPQPVEQTISNEEQAILWRSLERIPEIYREPLVLFYREHQSIETVAQNLELSEDTVKQRLSRGRKLLHEEVLAFVEGALEKTSPGKTFTLGVLAALSLTTNSAKAATVGVTAAKAGAATKTGATLGSAGGFLPVLGSLYFIFKSNLEYAKSPREREFMMWFFWIQIGSLLILMALLSKLVFSHSWVHDKKMMWVIFFFAPLALLFALGKYARHHRRQIQIEDGTWVEPMTHEQRKEHFDKLRRNGSKGRMYLYLGLACNMGGLAIIQLAHTWNGDRSHLLFLEFLSGFTLYLAVCAWRNRPR
ncbi:MAG TPA: RNA polymerase sigma factor [Verrucomicrobiae bacterium]